MECPKNKKFKKSCLSPEALVHAMLNSASFSKKAKGLPSAIPWSFNSVQNQISTINVHIHLREGCTGWPKRVFDQAPECSPGHLSSSSPLLWRCCHIAAATRKTNVQGRARGKEFVLLAVMRCAVSKKQRDLCLWQKAKFHWKHALLDTSRGAPKQLGHLVTMSCGQQRAKCTAKEVARPRIACATPLLPYCCW
eukprot:1159052-Pelagomonas_calceolata.AAC.12